MVRSWKLLLAIGSLFLFGQFGSAQQVSQRVQGISDQNLISPKAASSLHRHSVGRFLGWKYSALTHQDTSRWVGKSTPPTAQAENVVASTVKRQASPHAVSGSSFPYAGFSSAPELPVGSLPTAVAQGDFNGDGKMDLAISNGADNTIYVYLSNGDGTFALPEVLDTVGQSPVWLTAAKLRSTGQLDLIAVDGDSNQVEVFFGNGDGTFQPSTVIATLNQIPTFVLAGDFNKDGNIDLAVGLVVVSTQPQFEILFGDGTGSFPTTLIPPAIVDNGETAIATSWMAAGDINNDGQLDIVATEAFGGAAVYLNQSGTAFQPVNIYNPIDGAIAVSLADVDNDGCLDAVQTGGWGYLTIAKGNCDGTFTEANPTAALGDIDFAVTVADVNGDGKPDVVASSAFSDLELPEGGYGGAPGGYLVSVLDGDGTGNFSPAAIYRVGPDAYSLAVADVKGNGYPDIVTISQTESTASHLVNDGNGGFGSPSGETIGYLPPGVSDAPNPSGIAETVDLNGDGKPDVLLIEDGQNTVTEPSQITALLNDGTGKLSAPIRSPLTVGPNFPFPIFTTGKFRNSTTPDMIYVSQYESSVVAFAPGNGDGTFGAPITLATLPNPPDPLTLVTGDFNGDGKLDFAVLWGSGGSTAELDVFLGNGNGTFSDLPSQTFASLTTNTGPVQLVVGDFNHDGKLDLLIGNNTNGGWVSSGDDLDLMLGNGDGTFQSPTTLMSHFGPVAVADVNEDGYLDLIQARDPDANITNEALTAVGGAWIAPAITVYLGGPGGTFTKAATYYAPGIQIPSQSPPLVGDFNGDGKLDIALEYVQATIGRPWERRLQIFQGNGDGTFSTSGIPYQLPAYDQPVIGGDFRGVGLTDLLDLVGLTSSINTLSAAPAPAIAITADSSPLTGTQGSATVTLALPASSSETVTLSSSDPKVTVPASLTFIAGQTQQSFTFTLGSGYDSSHLLEISAALAGKTANAYFATANPNLKPGIIALIGGSTSGTTSVATSPGGSIPLLFTLESVNGYSGEFSQFTCSGLPSGASCGFAQSSMTLLPGGWAQVAFSLSTTSSIANGTYDLVISATNGEISPSTPLTLGIGGFSLSANPLIVQLNGNANPTTSVSANYTNGYSQNVQLSCNGLPSGASCVIPSILYPAVPSTTVSLTGTSSVAAKDYPFEIVGSAGLITTSVSATLRVSNFSATLASNSASLSAGQSATFNVEITSLNHFSNNDISVSCQGSANVTCTTPSEYASVSDGGTVTIPLKVTYVGPTTTAQARPAFRLPLGPGLACVGLLFLWTKRKRNAFRTCLGCLILLFLLSGLSACSSGGGSGSGGGTRSVPVNVSAQASTASGNLVQSAGTITLTVGQ